MDTPDQEKKRLLERIDRLEAHAYESAYITAFLAGAVSGWFVYAGLRHFLGLEADTAVIVAVITCGVVATLTHGKVYPPR